MAARTGGLVTAGLGVLAVGVGAVFGLQAMGASDALTKHTEGAWTNELLARHAEGAAAQQRMFWAGGAGLAAVAAAAAAYYFGSRGEGMPASGVSVVPSASGATAGASFVF